jgi:8-oxo-dGTP pyrophosphatase MutT (NUDIX family)
MDDRSRQIVHRLKAVLASRVRNAESGGRLTRAAVLVPLVEVRAGLHLLLTRRTDEVETHRGQIAFPGGVADGNDTDSIDTALRETEEELGIGKSSVEVLGLLDDLTTPTGFVITPIVGYFPGAVTPRPNPAEVAEVFTVPLRFLADERNATRETRRIAGKEREVWSYVYGDRLIWGATAWIIRSLLPSLLEAEGPST